MLPIREAYEWKLSDEVITQNVNALLPIREAYEWKLGFKFQHRSLLGVLLPIREAYEWKLSCARNDDSHEPVLLPIREAYEWKPVRAKLFSCGRQNPCFQFVKRMNGKDV